MDHLKSSESTLLKVTPDGGKSSNTEENTSSTSKTRRQSMSSKTRIKKDKKLSSGRDTTDGIRDGELSIKTSIPRSEVKDTAMNSVSIS
jgi:hypothetical protein